MEGVEVDALDWHGRPVLVTGATGLLGGWIVSALLARGATAVILLRDDVPHSYLSFSGAMRRCSAVRGDITDLDVVERILVEYEIDTVFHLAAQSQVGVARRGPYHTLESNVRGTYTVLEAVRRNGAVRGVLVASSDKAYGSHARLPYTEDMELLGTNPYDTSKAAADLIARSYAQAYGLPVVVTRCGNLFGGGDLNWARLVPGTIRSLLRERRPVIRSDGSPVRDYLYVSDAVEGCIALAARAPELKGQPFNLSLERPLSVVDMVELISRAVGRRLEPLLLNDAPGEIAEQYLSAERARTTVGWKPQVPLEDGLAETVTWYRTYLETIDGTLLSAPRPVTD